MESAIKEVRKINELENVSKQANDLFTDVRAEVIAAALMEQGYDPDYISLVRKGAARRNWNKDIDQLELQFSQHDLKDYLLININRGSIYDILPQNIFHRSSRGGKLNRDKEDIIGEIRVNRKEEFFARRFFHLFEGELDAATVKAYLHEARYDKKVSNPDFINIFTYYWPIIKLLKREQAIFFLHVIPLVNKIRHKLSEAAEAMSLILDVPVRLEEFKMQHKDTGEEVHSNLGSAKLGLDWVLGNTFDDGIFDLKLTLGPISGNEMRNYLGYEKGTLVLDYLCKLLLPGNVFVIKDYIVVQEDAAFVLSNNEHTSYLGINTFL